MTNTENSLAMLRSALDDCAQHYFSDDLETQRLAVLHALHKVTMYLEENGFPPQTLMPLLRPAQALCALHDGARDQMFAKSTRKGRSRNLTQDHLRSGILAGFANFWLKHHKSSDYSQEVKLNDCVRKMKAGAWFSEVTRAQLETAREIVSREGKDHLAVKTCKWLEEFFDKSTAMHRPLKAFELMVRYFDEHEVSRAMGILKTISIS